MNAKKSNSINRKFNNIAQTIVATSLLLKLNAHAEQKTDLFKTQSEYISAVHKISKISTLRPSDLMALSWIERIAAINVTCTNRAQTDCKTLLEFGMTDNALLVRDHSLRRIGQSDLFSIKEKSRLADQVIADDRNYRAGRSLWIVTTAQNLKRVNP